MSQLIASLFGLILILGSIAFLWAVRGPIRRSRHRRRLALAFLAWTGENIVLIIAISAILFSAEPPNFGESLPILLETEAALVVSVLGSLSVLRWAWGVPSLAD